MSDPEERIYCSACKTNKSALDFRLKKDGITRNKTCLTCSERTKQKRREEKEKENPGSQPEEEADDLGSGLGVLSLTDFLDALTEQEDILELGARIDTSSLSGSRQDPADELAAKIWTHMKYYTDLFPLYRHPALVPIDAEAGQYIEPIDGSITDGDDHAWSGNPEMLEGGGGWQDFDFRTTSLLGKRRRPDQADDSEHDTLEEEEVRHHFFPAGNGHDSDDEDEKKSKGGDETSKKNAIDNAGIELRTLLHKLTKI
ncbi:hypothetical protein DFH09DRAFT_1073124 [Mycena vulgaris]|nr:hypothetical protein DFH09DRAFT_1073124 [Mycena vulgaris]